MAFHVYPDPPTAPFSAAAAGTGGDTSKYLTVPELAGLTPEAGKPQFFVRIASSGAPVDGPSVWLKVTNTATGTSAEGEISAAHIAANPAQIGDGTHPGVVNAFYAGPDEHNVALVSVYTFVPGLAFEVKVQNRAAEPRDLVWVVATSEPESQQPWIDAEPFVPVPDEIPFNSGTPVLKSFQHTFHIPVANRGTGPLKITNDAGMPVVERGFLRLRPADPIAPNSTGEVEFFFHYTSLMPDAWVMQFTYQLDSNDPVATTDAGHNCEIAIGSFLHWKQHMTAIDGPVIPGVMSGADAELPPAQTAGEEETPSTPVASLSRSIPMAEEQPPGSQPVPTKPRPRTRRKRGDTTQDA